MVKRAFLSDIEILVDEPMARRGRMMLRALAESCPVQYVVTRSYAGAGRVLHMYGGGAAHRQALLARHMAKGGRVVLWDLGYWDRETALRFSVDGRHPTAEQLAAAPLGVRREHELREDSSADGHLLLAGIGNKEVAAMGGTPLWWEQSKLAALRRMYPGRRIAFRSKRPGPHLPGTEQRSAGTIEDALRGCALAVVRHSNVAVDACIAGVPVWCESGAATALYGDQPTAPSRAARAEFLRRLAWFNWDISEASDAWQTVLEATQ